ncbi:Hypothetical predicted protein [Pelobates cultripes]|uniref:Uncharacterized protein n=1 Tax=Pelobates cultripes TaxID=61616 RepID=A0AAD1W492_PELCU|nr:Hypothetical predicted protein [Pelobates cultripes]
MAPSQIVDVATCRQSFPIAGRTCSVCGRNITLLTRDQFSLYSSRALSPLSADYTNVAERGNQFHHSQLAAICRQPLWRLYAVNHNMALSHSLSSAGHTCITVCGRLITCITRDQLLDTDHVFISLSQPTAQIPCALLACLQL